MGAESQGNRCPIRRRREELEEEEVDFARWQWLFDDPLFALNKLTILLCHHLPARATMPALRAQVGRMK